MLKAFLLAGASMLAVVATSAEAGTVFNTPGEYTWTAPSAGVYDFEVWGAQGGASANSKTNTSYAGGLGAGVWAQGFVQAGQQLYILVGQQGSAGKVDGGGGGGGASAVLGSLASFNGGGIIAGGGGGAGIYGAGGDGQAPAAGGPGANGLGVNGYGQGGTNGGPGSFGVLGAPGGGLGTYGGSPYSGAGFNDGGAGGAGFKGGGAGGAGFAGGGGSFYSGGGGGGFSGGGGGGFDSAGDPLGGGGGGSFAPVGVSGGSLAYRTGNGMVEILSAVPEPSEWMLMLLGLAFTGQMLRRERWRRARGMAAAR